MRRRLSAALVLSTAGATAALTPRISPAQTPTRLAAASAPSTGNLEMDGLRAQLRQLVVREESYFAKHLSYTTDLRELGMMPGRDAASWVQVIYAGGRSWSGRAVLGSPAKKSCVIFVGELADSPQPPRTEHDHRSPKSEGMAVCDR